MYAEIQSALRRHKTIPISYHAEVTILADMVAFGLSIRGRKPGPIPKPARTGPGLGPEYVGPGLGLGYVRPGRASGRKVLIASGLVGPGLPCAFEFRLINNITI